MTTTTDGLTVFLTGDIDDTRLDALQAIAPESQLRHFPSQDAMEADIAQADVVAGHISADALARAQRLKWVHSWAAGPDTQLFKEFIDSDVVLTCSKSNGAIPLAEHAMMLMLMLNRNTVRWIDSQRRRQWDRFVHGELNGMTVGIIGTGYSGADLALKAKAFHMRVLGLRRSDAPAPNFDAVYKREQLHDMLAHSDFVVVTAPRTPETVGMLDEAAFRAMKRTAYYICFSRGGIAVDEALLRAVDEDWIAGAGLDAHDIEPLPADSPFWTLKNTIITPHNGATTTQTKARGYEIFRENLERYVSGRELINIADKGLGY